MARKSTWTKSEVSYLKKNWEKSTCKAIAATLGKKEQACFDKAHQLKLRKRTGYGTPVVVDKRIKTIRENSSAPKWTVSQVEFLKKNMGKMSDKEIANELGKTIPAVYCKRRSLKIVKSMRPMPDKEVSTEAFPNNHFKQWTREEEAIVKREFNKTSVSSIAKKLGRTEDAVKGRAYVLGLISSSEDHPRTKWTEEEVKYIKKHVKSKSYEEIGEYLGRSSAAVASKAVSLNIGKSPLKKSKKRFSLKNFFVGVSIAANVGLIAYIISTIVK